MYENRLVTVNNFGTALSRLLNPAQFPPIHLSIQPPGLGKVSKQHQNWSNFDKVSFCFIYNYIFHMLCFITSSCTVLETGLNPVLFVPGFSPQYGFEPQQTVSQHHDNFQENSWRH